VLPVLVLGFGLRRWSAARRVVFCCGVAAVYLAVWWTAYAATGAAWPVRFRLVTFVFGVGMYELLHSDWWKEPHGRKGELWALALLTVALAASYQLNVGNLAALDPPLRILLEVLAVSLGFTTFLVYAIGHSGWIQRALVWTPLRWLGNMSYSYYLVHLAALHGAALVLPRVLPFSAVEPIPYIVAASASFGITAVAAVVLFVTVERPFSLDARGLGIVEAARGIGARVLAVLALTRAAERMRAPEEPAP
jgi:peptidoglycan/LPS O-acetylase OafA/YrhL